MSRYPALSRLTAREWEILLLLMDGERVPSIAAELYVTQSTVRNHLSSVFSKLGVHSQAELLRQLRTN
jgi:DNA-binding NarL/FixJ family response regulator